MESDAETRHLAALHRYDILDTPPEGSFDRITRMAKSILQTPCSGDADRSRSPVVQITPRVGRGEEFAILLPETDLAGAAAIAERLRHAVETTPIEAGSAVVQITLSLGVATLTRPEQGVEAMLAAADAALYEAKTTGRSKVVCATAAQPVT